VIPARFALDAAGNTTGVTLGNGRTSALSYWKASMLSVYFAAGETDKTIEVEALTDNYSEANETFSVFLYNVNNEKLRGHNT
jgi:YD repeat-containing protein